ncbi:hypothetical protein WR25_24454 [Diploscapter pachys]|uniref:Ubiquinone biosynthesis monooxygenase COQ6, mitochondrial n=1 Tax=Diploscapter pachys TaxID=2018661 RepID=A0A2A2LIT5_9BILA|nr:hypothetical protein WR25_24454 [Diploscapter pachys]
MSRVKLDQEGVGGFQRFATKYFLSCTAALVAETVTYPLDITKTRLQIARNKFTKGGMLRVTYDIVRREGPLMLWTGVGPAITRHYIYTGIRIGMYEWLRDLVHDKKDGVFPVYKAMMAGAVSGLVAQFAASPTDLVKVQMQMEGLRKLQGQTLRYTGAIGCFLSLYRTQGFFGLWIGWVPNCQRAALLNMADIATYDFVKHKLILNLDLQDNWLTHAMASCCAGFAAAVVSLPSDVVKTRMMDQIRHELDAKMDKKQKTTVDRYSGVIDCFVKIIKNEGFFSLYKGFLPSYIRMAPWSLTFWMLLRRSIRFYVSSRKASSYFDTVIVGGGLVGNAMACAIGSNKNLQNLSVLLIESGTPKPLAKNPGAYSNRVSAVSPASIELFKKLQIWDRLQGYRVKKVNKLHVLDSCSNSEIFFDQPNAMQEIAYIIENDAMVGAMYEKLRNFPNITVKTGATVSQCSLTTSLSDLATVVLSDGETIETSLLIGADGHKSKVREAMRVDYTSWDYEQHALVATVQVEPLGANDVAWQRFTSSGPIALLPLSDSLSSLIWTTSPQEADKLKQLPPDNFIDQLNHALFTEDDQNDSVNQALFTVKKACGMVCNKSDEFKNSCIPHAISLQPDNRATFPLGLNHAHSYISLRSALIGDAAHRVHPLAGQGVNLGWSDVAILTNTIEDTVTQGGDLGSLTSLQEYDSIAQRNNVPVMVAIDWLNRLYKTDAPPLVLLRSLGLSAVNQMTPLKDFLIHRLSSSRV